MLTTPPTIINKIDLKKSQYNEKMIENLIRNNPNTLPIKSKNNLQFVRSQKSQDKGIVDLILESSDDDLMYVVEVQLGRMDPSHIVRLIEYWNVEQTRNPSCQYKAVLVAKDISRYLNVIQLLQYSIPFIIIQMVATQIDNNIGLFFTKVCESTTIEPQGNEQSDNVNEDWWIKTVGTKQVQVAKTIFEMTNQLNVEYSWNKHFELNYVESYIGIKDDNGLFLVMKFSNNQIFLSGKSIIGKYCKETPAELEGLITISSMSRF